MPSLFFRAFIKDFIPFFLFLIFFLSFLAWVIFFISGIISFLASPLTLLEYFLMEIKEFPYFLELILPFSWVFSLTYTLFKFKQNNYLIIIEQAGISLKVLKRPLFLIAFFIILFILLMNEFFTFPLKRSREEEREKFLGISPTQKEFLFLVNEDKNQIIMANEFNLKDKKLKKVLILFIDLNRKISKIIKSEILVFIDDVWIFERGFLWERENSLWTVKKVDGISTSITLNPFEIFLKGKKWDSFSFFELIYFLRMNLGENNPLSFPLLHEIIFRIFSFLFYFLAISWSFNITKSLEKVSFLKAILASLSFNFLYIIINLILVHLTSLKLLSLEGFLLIQFIFLVNILFYHGIFSLNRFWRGFGFKRIYK